MLIALDVGNTNMTLGLLRNGRLEAARRAVTPRGTADELELLFDGLLGLDGLRLADVDRIVVASVVPSVEAAITEVARRRGLAFLRADATTVPIPVRVERPDEVGADRLVNALAAGRLHGRPAMVLDFGTATTVDVIAADGGFIGGAIAPGLELGLEALAARTARLPRVEPVRPSRAIGRDTAGAMQSGAVFGYLGLARELLDRIRAELLADAQPGTHVHVVLTGGLSRAPWIAELPGVDAIDPDLTLKGLAIVAAEAPAGAWSTGGWRTEGRHGRDGLRRPAPIGTLPGGSEGPAR